MLLNVIFVTHLPLFSLFIGLTQSRTLNSLDSSIHLYLAEGLALATRCTYSAGTQSFTSFCSASGIRVMPATEAALCYCSFPTWHQRTYPTLPQRSTSQLFAICTLLLVFMAHLSGNSPPDCNLPSEVSRELRQLTYLKDPAYPLPSESCVALKTISPDSQALTPT